MFELFFYLLFLERKLKKNRIFPSQPIESELLVDKFGHLSDVQIRFYENVKPELLIGMNNAEIIMMNKPKY